MEDGKLLKQLFYGELTQGTRGIGRPKLRYRDSLNANLKKCNIDIVTWEKQAAERGKWRTTINIKIIESEQAREMAMTADPWDPGSIKFQFRIGFLD